MNPADFHVHRVTDDAVYIIDDDLGNLSVTNDAERVVEAVFAKYGNRRIIYRDSEDQWDELIHENGEFKRFKPGSVMRGEEPR